MASDRGLIALYPGAKDVMKKLIMAEPDRPVNPPLLGVGRKETLTHSSKLIPIPGIPHAQR